MRRIQPRSGGAPTFTFYFTGNTVCVSSISNKIKDKERMDERVKLSLCEREFIFPPYDPEQLNDIMQARSDAFHEGVLNKSVIPKAAALAAREHGDAHKAIDILRDAAEIAQAEKDDRVREEYVIQARERDETDRFRELIRGLTPHSRYVLQALTLLSLNNDDGADEGFRTTRVYETHEQICWQDATDSLSLRRVCDLLKQHAFLDVREQSRYSGGSAKGVYTKYKLLADPEIIRNVLQADIEAESVA